MAAIKLIQKLASTTYGSHEKGESSSDGADSLEPVVGDHQVGELGEPVLGEVQL